MSAVPDDPNAIAPSRSKQSGALRGAYAEGGLLRSEWSRGGREELP